MNDLEQAIQALEFGWSTAKSKKGRPGRKKELHQRMTYHKVPGFSIAFIDREELAWAKGYGVREAGQADPVTIDTIFQAASISKPVTAIVALRLVEAGFLDLDADVNDILRTWKLPKSKHTQVDGAYRPVTLRGLLSHTAGVTPRGYPGYPLGKPLPTLRQILDGKPP